MIKTKKFIIGTLISVVTLGGVIAYASPGSHLGKFGGMHNNKAEFIIERISSKLELNDVQKQNLLALKSTLKEQRELHKPANPRAEIIALLSAPVLDETKVLAMVEERTNKMRIAAPKVVTALANFTNSLSDEQRAEIQEFANKIGNRHGKGHHKALDKKASHHGSTDNNGEHQGRIIGNKHHG